jgi:hypothetical protein
MRIALLVFAAEGARFAAAPLAGKAAFIGVFVALLVWLLLLPPRLIDEQGQRCPWWRNVRFWAVVVTLAQIGVYYFWG